MLISFTIDFLLLIMERTHYDRWNLKDIEMLIGLQVSRAYPTQQEIVDLKTINILYVNELIFKVSLSEN